jgi:AraC-like DNA-binding protein
MSYRQFRPHPDLSDYIDAYWMVQGVGQKLIKSNILPDGCVDLIFNLGDYCRTDKGLITMASGKSYLVGTMTTARNSFVHAGNKLIGVRFKPAAFSSFFKFTSLNAVTDQTIEFDRSLSPDLHKLEMQPVAYLNSFFLHRLKHSGHHLTAVVKDMERTNGQMNISDLAKRHHMTARQLERHFQQYIGTTPKAFANIVRFRAALAKIRDNSQQDSLLSIAFDCGYYDHAHLTNDIKRYTGLTPSLI